MGKVLIIEDSEDLRLSLRDLVGKAGCTPFTAATGAEGLRQLECQLIDVVFLDIGLPDADGIELISVIHDLAPDVDIVMLTGNDDARSAVNSLKSGAVDYILKPFDLVEFRHILNRLMAGRLSARQETLASREKSGTVNLIGNSRGMIQLKDDIQTAAQVRVPVLVTGETGTGKEMVARAIHRLAGAGAGVFAKVDCGTLSASIIEAELFGSEKGAYTDARETRKGLVEIADGGVLFLDEIGNLPLALQPKLLRLVEESTFRRVGGVKDIQVNVRIVAATNADVVEEVRRGRFREDLFYRLNVIGLTIPPLRERGGDVILLANHFLRHFAGEMKKRIKGFSPRTEQLFLDHDWPGNVRELKNIIERTVIYCQREWATPVGLDVVRTEDGHAGDDELVTLRDMERRYIRKVLLRTGNNKSAAARILDISRTTLRDKLKD
ncbi:MAG: sigma-54 dependent transcriptional regulator [Desulfobulbales bacterium]|nr:sigma-54 dependent transcriptional regulator [Desulfobulbales bacterium]